MKKGLDKYKQIAFQNISILYGKELIQFNLSEELRINEDDLNSNLKRQPSYYGFLLLLHKKLTTEYFTLKERRKKTWAKLYLRAKKKTMEGSNRPYTEEMAKAYADSHDDYSDLTERCIKAKDEADTIFSAVKAFEQRKDVLQTIASNTRKQF